MTHQLDVARGRDVVARWCTLAERRLEYLTELFETGRWRRFHSELDFLENIQEAKAAVATWRDLSSREASLDNNAIDLSWLRRPRTKLPPVERWPDPVPRPEPAANSAEPRRSIISIVPKAELFRRKKRPPRLRPTFLGAETGYRRGHHGALSAAAQRAVATIAARRWSPSLPGQSAGRRRRKDLTSPGGRDRARPRRRAAFPKSHCC